MQLTVLGSGSALPTHRRASSGFLLEWSGGALLIDASSGTYMRALKAGLDPHRLEAVVISHFHPDHIADLPGLLWARRQDKDLETTLRIVGPEGAAEWLARLRAPYGEWLEVPCAVSGFPFEHAGLRVLAFPARHSPEAVCLRIEADGRSLAYSGDTGDCEGLRSACREVDLALLECTVGEPEEGHMTERDCAAVIEAARPRRSMLVHLGPDVAPELPAAEDGLVVTV